jgi:hypothetical protein
MSDMDHGVVVLLEHMDRKVDLILEMLAPLPQMQKDLSDIKDQLGRIDADLKEIIEVSKTLRRYA